MPCLRSEAVGENLLDTGAPFYDVYRTKDGQFLSVYVIQPRTGACLRRFVTVGSGSEKENVRERPTERPRGRDREGVTERVERGAWSHRDQNGRT